MKLKVFTFFLILIIYFPAVGQKTYLSKDTLKVYGKEISITALRYPEKINEVPMAITKIDFTKLNSINGLSLVEPLSEVPGLLVQERSGTSDVRITVRGFGARGAGDRSNSGTSRGLKFYLNGLPLTEPDGRTAFDFIEPSILNDIEIIRSNSSAIWGNAAGGMISFRTEPEYVTPLLKIQANAGSFGLQKFSLSGGYNYTNGLFYSNIVNSKFDGFRLNSQAERTLIDLGFSSRLNDKSKISVFVDAVQNKFNIPGPLTQAAFDTNYTSANSNYLQRKERRNNNLLLFGLTLDNNFDESNSVSAMFYGNPKYLQRSERGTYRDFTRYNLGGSFSFKNLSYFSGNFKNIILIGIDEQYQDGSILFYKLTSDAQRSDTLADNKKEGANIAGIFIQNEFVAWDKFSLIIGLRYDDLTYSNQNFMELNSKETKDFTAITPKLGISWKHSEFNMQYFNIGSGVEVPAGNETDPDPDRSKLYLINPLLDPIYSQTYELGTKNHFFINTFLNSINLDAAFYYISTKNDIIPYSGGKFYMTAGETGKIGFEAFTDFEFDYGLSLDASFTYMTAKYLDYKVDSIFYDKSKSGIIADYSNNKVAGIPDYFYNINLRYNPEFLDLISITLNTISVSTYYSDDANKIQVPSYTIFNAKISTTKPIKIFNDFKVMIFASFNNIADLHYASSAFINPDLEKKTNVPYFLEPGMPRNFTFGISLGWK